MSDKVTNLKTTLGKLQNNFPIELKDAVNQSFTFKDWGMKEEKLIAKAKEKNPSVGRFINHILCEMLETLGGEDFSSLDLSKRKLKINQLPMGEI